MSSGVVVGCASLTGSTHWGASTTDDNRAALVKEVHLAAGKQDMDVM